MLKPREEDPLDTVLEELADDAPLQGRDMKHLRDATSSAIARVWSDSCAASSLLSQKINEGNEALAQRLNDSFALVGRRSDTLSTISMFQADAPAPKVTPFSGSFDQGPQFSLWLRRLEDVMRMRPTPMSEEQRANFVVGHLDGVAREKVEELSEEARKDFNTIVPHPPAYFEGPDQRDMARQKLSICRLEQGESFSTFAQRLLHLVRAAMMGQDSASQKDRTLEEFVGCLRGDRRYFVKLDRTGTFEQAVVKTQTVEQLINEATADRLMNPGAMPSPAPALVAARPVDRSLQWRDSRAQIHERTSGFRNRGAVRARRSQEERGRVIRDITITQSAAGPQCFKCGGAGHFQRVCPPPPVTRYTPNQRSCEFTRFPSANRGASRPRSVQRARPEVRACTVGPEGDTPVRRKLALPS
ncbi:hypothetical protein Q1695_003681 [Nippostrongylus brasiliensis]|nr:hypothetical protein Q1695_003681 [Nippostrongylus brasiliensis]